MSDIELKSLLADRELGTPTGRIVRALSERGAMSAAQIARLSGMAKSTVSTTLRSLRESGLVVENQIAGSGKVGRPATILTLNPHAGTCVGVLIGLQHIQVILADVSHAVLADKTFALETDYSPELAVEVATRLVRESYAEQGLPMESLLGVGIAVAGPVNPVNGRMLRASGVPTWVGVDVPELFRPAFRRPVIADNESNCSAIAEMTWGAAIGHEDFVMFTVDVGVGGAIVAGGRVLRGIAGGAGEFGHMSIDPDGPLCRCGNRGCLELYASFETPLKHASNRFGRPMTVEQVIGLALEGDIGCRRLVEDTAEIAGRGLGIIGTAVNPGLIVVGGRLALAGDLFMRPLRASFDKHTLVKCTDVPSESRTELRAARFIANDACMGAVGLVLRRSRAEA
jgi:predicted NBD/HSP70 family sugar kinase